MRGLHSDFKLNFQNLKMDIFVALAIKYFTSGWIFKQGIPDYFAVALSKSSIKNEIN